MSECHAFESAGLNHVAHLCEQFADEVAAAPIQEYRVASERADRKATAECLLAVSDTARALMDLLERCSAMHSALTGEPKLLTRAADGLAGSSAHVRKAAEAVDPAMTVRWTASHRVGGLS